VCDYSVDGLEKTPPQVDQQLDDIHTVHVISVCVCHCVTTDYSGIRLKYHLANKEAKAMYNVLSLLR
jgi:hypothetical protein